MKMMRQSMITILLGKKGTTTLKVKLKDGDYEEEIEIKVMSSYDNLELVDQVTFAY